MTHHQPIDQKLLAFLRCPQSAEPLQIEGDMLVSSSGRHRYPITESGIPLFAGEYWTEEAALQGEHYDRVAKDYTENLTYRHTRAYMQVLDDLLMDAIAEENLGHIAEICCGSGEAFLLLRGRIAGGIGVDVSQAMLEVGRADVPDEDVYFIQGDAVKLPIEDGVLDNVIMLGGIHHVNDRDGLFSEIKRILKPGGKFYWREPVSDLFLWRWLRFVIYKLSPNLDFDTERPLRYKETRQQLERSGLQLKQWQTAGFIGFMLFMNSDVLIFNRLFHHVPGIERITRFFATLDKWIIKLPGMKKFGLQVVGYAVKPEKD